MLTGDKMLRVGGRVLAEVGELDGRLVEERLALSADGGVKDLCEGEEGVNFRSRSQGDRCKLTLHDIVGVRVDEHGLDDARTVGTESEHLLDHVLALLIVGVEDTLLDDIGGELLLGERKNLAVDLGDDERAVGLLSLLDDPLDHVLLAEKS